MLWLFYIASDLPNSVEGGIGAVIRAIIERIDVPVVGSFSVEWIRYWLTVSTFVSAQHAIQLLATDNSNTIQIDLEGKLWNRVISNHTISLKLTFELF